MPRDDVRKDKEEARGILNKMPKFRLKRDVFFIHGWGDEANECWTYRYTERAPEETVEGWKYTIKDWIEELVINKEKVHYVRLVEDEGNAPVVIDKKTGQLQKDISKDKTYCYESFFQFAELLKDKIVDTGAKEFDLVCHSMGGLDSVAAIAVDKKQDDTKTITTPYLEGTNLLITVATPHQGSPAAELAGLTGGSKYIIKQGKNMGKRSAYIKLVNSTDIRNQLLERIVHLYMYGGGNEVVVPTSSYTIKIDGLERDNYTINEPLTLGRHSMRMGITQDPRIILEIFNILKT